MKRSIVWATNQIAQNTTVRGANIAITSVFGSRISVKANERRKPQHENQFKVGESIIGGDEEIYEDI